MSSSSYRSASTDLPDPLSPPVSIVHLFLDVFKATSSIVTELLYIGSSWSSCFCSSMSRDSQEYIAYEFVLISPAVSSISGSSNLDSFRNGWHVAVQLLFCGVLPPGFVQYCSQHSYVIAVNLFLHTFSWRTYIYIYFKIKKEFFFSFIEPTEHRLYGHQPPITKTIQIRRTRHAGHCWRSKDEPIYNNSVPKLDIAWKTCRERWTIEISGEKGLGRSVLVARHGIYIYIYT